MTTDDVDRSAASRLARSGSVFIASTAVQGAAAVVALPVVTRWLEPAEFGVIAVAMTVTQVVAFIAGLGLPPVLARPLYDRDGHGQMVARRLTANATLAAVMVIIMIDLTGPVWSAVFASIEYSAALRLAVVTAIPTTVVAAVQSILRAERRPIIFGVVAVTATVGGQAAGVALLAADPTPSNYMRGILVASVTAAIVGLVAIRACLLPLGPRDVRPWLVYGLPTVPHAAAIYLVAVGDRAVIEAVLGPAAAGRYQVAYVLGGLTITVLGSVNNAWAPLVFGAAASERWALLARTSRLLTRLTAYAAASLALGVPTILGEIAPGYRTSALAPVVSLVAVSAIPFVVYLSSAQVVFFERRTAPLAWITPCCAVGNIMLNVLLLPRMGLIGAAIATLVTYVVLATGVASVARRTVDVPWDRRGLLKDCVMAAAGAAAGSVLPLGTVGTWVRVSAATAIAFVAINTVRRAIRRGAAGTPTTIGAR